MAFLTYPLGAFFMYLCARRHLGRPAAFVTGVAFAFYAGRYFAPPHYHMLGTQYFPLVIFALEEWLDSGKPSAAFVLALGVALQCLSSVYLMYAMVLMLVLVTPLATWQYRERLDRRRVLGLLLAGATVVSVIGLVMWPYLVLRHRGLVPSYDGSRTSIGLVPWFAHIHVRRYLLHQGIGIFGYLLAAFGVILGGRIARGWPCRLGLCLTIYGIIMSLGPRIWTSYGEIWSPYSLLLGAIPGFSTVRMPARFTVIAHLGLSLLVGVAIAVAVRRLSTARAWLVAGLCALVILLPARSVPELVAHRELVGDSVRDVDRWLARNGDGRAALELPQAIGAEENSRRGYLSTFHWHPIVDGYAANVPQHGRRIHWIARQLPAEVALQELVDLIDVGWLIVHRGALPPLARSVWNGPLPDGLEPYAESGDDALYKVSRVPRNDRRSLLLSTTETLEGTPITPLEAACPGRIAFAKWNDAPVKQGADSRATITMENRSSSTWPAFGFYPRHLVHLVGAIRDADGHDIGDPFDVPIRADLHPFAATEIQIRFTAPAPGSYRLHLELVQNGVKALRDCGVPPFELDFVVDEPGP